MTPTPSWRTDVEDWVYTTKTANLCHGCTPHPTIICHGSWTLHEDCVIKGESRLQVFNMQTGDVLNSLTEPGAPTISTDVQGSCILSGDNSDGIFIWNLQDVLNGTPVTPLVVVDPGSSKVDWNEFLRFGRNMFVRYSWRISSAKVFDFK